MRGDLVRSRVVDDPGVALAAALERALTGYAVLRPAAAVLFDDAPEGVLTLDDGVPVAAAHGETAGADAVAAMAGRGPYRVALYANDDAPTAPAGEHVAPGVPAEVLADDPALAERCRERAPDDATTPGGDGAGESVDALTAFLENEAKIAAIQERARQEATRRAAEWGIEVSGDDERPADSSADISAGPSSDPSATRGDDTTL